MLADWTSDVPDDGQDVTYDETQIDEETFTHQNLQRTLELFDDFKRLTYPLKTRYEVRAELGVLVDDNHLFVVVVDSRSILYRKVTLVERSVIGDIHFFSRLLLFIGPIEQVSSPNPEMVVKNKFIDDISALVALVVKNFKFVRQHSMKFGRNKFKWNTVPLYLKKGIDQLLGDIHFCNASVVYRSRFIGPIIQVRAELGVLVDDNHLFVMVVDSRSKAHRNKFKWNTVPLYLKKGIDQLLGDIHFCNASVVYRSRFIVSSPNAEMVVKIKFIDDISALVALVVKIFKFVRQHSMKFGRNKFKWNTVPLYLKKGIDQLLGDIHFC
ncbi:hypothetical protein GQR58_005374 [Nymphon striatum]|nr:hypothetical protein GQR58_005374 [Nymphon striatum]